MPGLTAPADHCLPDWLPDRVRLYLSHTEDGLSIRALARQVGLNASTVMRQVRRFEMRRDDPLMDEALSSLSRDAMPPSDPDRKDAPTMTAPIRAAAKMTDEVTLLREGRRVLRRLAEPGAVLAIAPDMEKAVVMREFPDGRSARTGGRGPLGGAGLHAEGLDPCRKAAGSRPTRSPRPGGRAEADDRGRGRARPGRRWPRRRGCLPTSTGSGANAR
jgi:transposase-like protein